MRETPRARVRTTGAHLGGQPAFAESVIIWLGAAFSLGAAVQHRYSLATPPSVSERREAYHCRAGEDPVGRARARLTKSAFSASVIASRKDSASDFDGQR